MCVAVTMCRGELCKATSLNGLVGLYSEPTGSEPTRYLATCLPHLENYAQRRYLVFERPLEDQSGLYLNRLHCSWLDSLVSTPGPGWFLISLPKEGLYKVPVSS